MIGQNMANSDNEIFTLPHSRQEREKSENDTTLFWCKEFLSRGSAEETMDCALSVKKKDFPITHIVNVCMVLN